jgi:hypothetical protein
MRWQHITGMVEKRSAYRIFGGKPVEEGLSGRHRCRLGIRINVS